MVTASEGPGYDVAPAPQRFLGHAYFQVSSVAPHDGGVTFWVIIGDIWDGGPWNHWPPGPLNLWTDITVFDPSDPSGQN